MCNRVICDGWVGVQRVVGKTLLFCSKQVVVHVLTRFQSRHLATSGMICAAIDLECG